MEPPRFFFWRWGGASTHPDSPHLGEGDWGDTIQHPNTPHYPISHHIDEDAL